MPRLCDLQQAFAAHVLGQGDQVGVLSAHLAARPGWGKAERLSLHRNTSLITLREALEALYPVVQRLVGEAFFAHLCKGFLAESPPTMPVLYRWGEGFADYLSGHPDCGTVPYLADVAALEWARNRAQHAADRQPLTAHDLVPLAHQAVAAVEPLRLALHGSATVLVSPWPVLSLWQANQQEDPPPMTLESGECLLVWRAGMQVMMDALSPAEAAFLARIAAGDDLDRALPTAADFDLKACLTKGLEGGWFMKEDP